MLNETRIEGLALSAGGIAVEALIETQVILQLLVKKGIVTSEDVAVTREVVRRQPKYKKLLQDLEISSNKVEESAKFEELLYKAFQPGGKETMTDEEWKYLYNKLDYISKNTN